MKYFLFYFVYILALLIKEDCILWINLALFQAGIFLLIKRYSFRKLFYISVPCVIISAIYLFVYSTIPKEVDYSHATEITFELTEQRRNMINLYWLGFESIFLGNLVGLVSFIWRYLNPYMSDNSWHHGVIVPTSVLLTYVLLSAKKVVKDGR